MDSSESNWVIEDYKSSQNQSAEPGAETSTKNVVGCRNDYPGDSNRYTEISLLVHLVKSLAELECLQPLCETNKHITTQICLLFLLKKDVLQFNRKLWQGQHGTMVVISKLLRDHSRLSLKYQKVALVDIIIRLNENVVGMLKSDMFPQCSEKNIMTMTQSSEDWIRCNSTKIASRLHKSWYPWYCWACCFPFLGQK